MHCTLLITFFFKLMHSLPTHFQEKVICYSLYCLLCNLYSHYTLAQITMLMRTDVYIHMVTTAWHLLLMLVSTWSYNVVGGDLVFQPAVALVSL